MDWRSVPNWPGVEVSTNGAVRSRGITRKPYLTRTGYLYLVVRKPGAHLCVAVHRLVAMAFHGPEPFSGAQVAHLDGNKTNNRPGNLQWCSRSENERHKVLHGRSNRGARQGRSKLKERDVLVVRKMRDGGFTAADIASLFGRPTTTIKSVLRGDSWSWL